MRADLLPCCGVKHSAEDRARGATLGGGAPRRRRSARALTPLVAASRRCLLLRKKKNFNRLSVAQVRRVMKSPAATSQTRVATRPHSLPPTDLPTGSTPGALPLMLATPPAPSAFGSVWYAGTQHPAQTGAQAGVTGTMGCALCPACGRPAIRVRARTSPVSAQRCTQNRSLGKWHVTVTRLGRARPCAWLRTPGGDSACERLGVQGLSLGDMSLALKGVFRP